MTHAKSNLEADMSMDTEFWRQLRPPGEELQQPVRLSRAKRITKKMKTIRDAIFRLIRPGMFLILISTIFIYTPDLSRQSTVGTCLHGGG